MGKINVAREDTHIVAHPGCSSGGQPQTEVDLDDVSISPIVGDRLFIGNLASAIHLTHLNPHKITHVLSVCPEFTRASLPAFIPEENWMQIPIRDNEKEELLPYFEQTCDFIENALKKNNSRVLVHCVMGVSRSVAVTCAYLMRTYSLSPLSALTHLYTTRTCAHPNYGFFKQLEMFYKCGWRYDPESSTYREWSSGKKSRRVREVERWGMWVGDVVKVKVSVGNEEDEETEDIGVCDSLPPDPLDQFYLLREMGYTHLLTISSQSSSSSSSSSNPNKELPFSRSITTYPPPSLTSFTSSSQLFSSPTSSSDLSTSSQSELESDSDANTDPSPTHSPLFSPPSLVSHSDSSSSASSASSPASSQAPSPATSASWKSPSRKRDFDVNGSTKEAQAEAEGARFVIGSPPEFVLDAGLFESVHDNNNEIDSSASSFRPVCGLPGQQQPVLITHYDLTMPSYSSSSSSLSPLTPGDDKRQFMASLESAVRFISDALSDNQTEGMKGKDKNSVLIYSPSEVVGCVVLSAYVSQSRHLPPRKVYDQFIRDALPLFDPAREKGVYWKILEGWWEDINAPAPSDGTTSHLSNISANLNSVSSSSSIDKDMDKLTLLSSLISKHVPSTSDRFYETERDRMKDRTREFDVSGYREALGRILEGRESLRERRDSE